MINLETCQEPNPRDCSPADIQRAVCAYAGLHVSDLRGLFRTQPLTRYRQIAYYLCRKFTIWSYPAIGEQFGGRDHATIIHGERKVRDLIGRDERTARAVAEIERTIVVVHDAPNLTTHAPAGS